MNHAGAFEEEDEDYDMPEAGSSKRPVAETMDVDNEEDPEDDEEDDEDDEDDEEDEDEERPRKKKRRGKRNAISRFIDTEAVVDDDDEDVDEDEEEYQRETRDFIATGEDEGDDIDHLVTAGHHRFARREQEEDDTDLQRVAQDLKERYSRTAARYTGDTSDIPQRLLMPGVADASLWQVRCRPGKERELVIQLMRKALDMQYTTQPLDINSAFERGESLPGMIYVEARSQQSVKHAIDGLVGVFATRGIVLVPVDEMASLLRIKRIQTTITPGSWVRIKRGKYAGDLAQVLDVTDNGEEAGLKFIPRIDLTPREDTGDKKRKKGAPSANQSVAFRPPQRFFNAEEVSKVFKGKVNLKPGHSRKFVFAGDTYNNGFIEKDVRITGLITENVNPTLDEIAKFTAGDQESADGENAVDLSIIAADARKAAMAVLQPGDHVEVFEGEQTGMHGTVESINGDIVVIRAKDVDIEGQKIEVQASNVRKKFKAGDHIKVMAGKNADETGLVVSVLNDTVTFLSDMTMQEVTVFAKDVREAAEVGVGGNTVGNYELHDLVQLDQQTVGVIYKTERDSFRVLDQNGQIRLVQPHQITMRKDSRRAIATDAQGYEIRIGDNMKELEGEGRKGTVLHIHQSFYAFLHNREIAENGGVFLARARGLVSVAPKGAAAMDLSKMNPLVHKQGGVVGSAMMSKGGRDKLIGTPVTVVQGHFKGYVGTIKDTNGNDCRVELHTQRKVITIDKSKLRRRDAQNKLHPLESTGFNMGDRPRGNMGPPPTPSHARATPNPYGGGMTPGGVRRLDGRTPNPYADGGRTPGFAGDGGRTPGSNPWAASSRTPNPYALSGRTPNPYSDGNKTPFGGGRTPGRPTGGATPNPYNARNDPRRPGMTPAGAGASSGGWGSGGDGWGQSTDDWSAPTPGGAVTAPTPGNFANGDGWGEDTAETPGVYAGAPTPYASAPTPGVSNAQTPGWGAAPTPGSLTAPTPGFAAPTPGFSAPTPGAWGADHDDQTAHWLRGCKYVWAKIEPDQTGSSFDGGTFDDFDVIVLSVNETAGLTNNATCRMMTGPERGGNRSIPLTYLYPIRPGVGDNAMLIQGLNAHKTGKVQSMQTAEMVILLLDSIPGQAADEALVPIADLAKYQYVE